MSLIGSFGSERPLCRGVIVNSQNETGIDPLRAGADPSIRSTLVDVTSSIE